ERAQPGADDALRRLAQERVAHRGDRGVLRVVEGEDRVERADLAVQAPRDRAGVRAGRRRRHHGERGALGRGRRRRAGRRFATTGGGHDDNEGDDGAGCSTGHAKAPDETADGARSCHRSFTTSSLLSTCLSTPLAESTIAAWGNQRPGPRLASTPARSSMRPFALSTPRASTG